MPRVSQQHRDARRDQILSAARRCFLRDGFHATSMQDLFGESGLSAGAVYRYFASKDDVILAIAEDNMHEVLTLINQVATADPSRSVGDVVAGALGLIQAKHEADGVGGTAILVWSEALRNPELAAQLQALLTGMLGLQPEPTYGEVAVWLIYVVAMLLFVLWPHGRRALLPATAPVSSTTEVS